MEHLREPGTPQTDVIETQPWWGHIWAYLGVFVLGVVLIAGATAPVDDEVVDSEARPEALAPSTTAQPEAVPVSEAPVPSTTTTTVQPTTTTAPPSTTAAPTTTVDPQAAVRAETEGWLAAHGHSSDEIASALAEVTAAAASGQNDTMGTACEDLDDAVEAARAALPAPDPILDHHLRTAYDQLSASASVCTQGIATGDTTQLTHAGHLQLRAGESLDDAAVRLAELL